MKSAMSNGLARRSFTNLRRFGYRPSTIHVIRPIIRKQASLARAWAMSLPDIALSDSTWACSNDVYELLFPYGSNGKMAATAAMKIYSAAQM
jgi:hypothetical protein